MLAGPRRKQKISADPRNKTWSEDTNRFGQRLMKQMGWQHGKGLGLNEDGKTEHIKVSLKNNSLGLGFDQSVEDNWISHQDDFNNLLSNLHQEHGQGSTKSQPDPPSSIEEKSKKAKRRVHYKKFTRGKDLANRSLSDMNCVLGRRSGSNTPQSASAPSSDHENEEVQTASHGVKTVVNSVSMQEYFAQKMSQMKTSRLNGSTERGDSLKAEDDDKEGDFPRDEEVKPQVCKDDENGEGNRKKKKKGKKRKRKPEDEDGDNVREKKGDYGDEMTEEEGNRENIVGVVGSRMNGLEETEGAKENEILDEGDNDLIRREGGNENGEIRYQECEDGEESLKRKKKKKKKRKVIVDED